MDTNVGRGRSGFLTDIIVPVVQDAGVSGVVTDGEMVSFVSATATKTVLVSHGSRCGLVENTLIEIIRILDQIVKEGSCGVNGDVRVRKAGSIVIARGALDQGEKLKSNCQRIFNNTRLGNHIRRWYLRKSERKILRRCSY